MPLFRRTPEPSGYRPTEAEVAEAVARLNSGSHHAAYDLTAHSGDRRQETAMRILGHCVEAAEWVRNDGARKNRTWTATHIELT